MNLGIVGTGTMGKVLADYAAKDEFFKEIYMIEPMDDDCWPKERLDLIIDFSHPKALKKIYEYCRNADGGIAVVLATTGYSTEEERLIEMLEKICPLKQSSNFSRGVEALTKMCKVGQKYFEEKGADPDIKIFESHHIKKNDAPSGTALSIAREMGMDFLKEGDIVSLRMGNVYGEHSVFFALEDEILEVRHCAYSKKIFAAGALAEGKKLLEIKRNEKNGNRIKVPGR